MTWIKGREQRRIDIRASIDEVYAFLVSPARRSEAFDDILERRPIDEGCERWIMKPRTALKVTVQPDYTTRYTGDGKATITWEPAGEGTTRTRGVARLETVGEGLTRVDYDETIESDLPIPRMMVRVFEPIVAHEIRQGVRNFLDRTKKLLEAGGDRG